MKHIFIIRSDSMSTVNCKHSNNTINEILANALQNWKISVKALTKQLRKLTIKQND